MLVNVKFNDIESYDDLKLILTSREISAPIPKTKYVEIEGADGFIDLTEAFGEPKYKDRKIKLVFTCIDSSIPFWEHFSDIQNSIHGKRMKIVFSDDDLYYYLGRISVDKWNSSKSFGIITVYITCDPYKYFFNETIYKDTITGTKVITLLNDRMTVIPKFNIGSGSVTIQKDGVSITSISNQDFFSDKIKLIEGFNTLTVTGSGTLIIKYQEGSF